MARQARKAHKTQCTKAKKTLSHKKTKRAVQASKTMQNMHWITFLNLQKKINQAWTKLRSDMAHKAPISTLAKDRDHLLLLLGECNYMENEYKRLADNQ